jgi:hypothetical protein
MLCVVLIDDMHVTARASGILFLYDEFHLNYYYYYFLKLF